MLPYLYAMQRNNPTESKEKPMIRIAARQTVRADACEEFERIAAELIEITRTEEGNHGYTLTHGIENPQVYCFFEVWESMEAVESHLNSEHFKRIAPQLDALMAEGAVLDVYEEV